MGFKVITVGVANSELETARKQCWHFFSKPETFCIMKELRLLDLDG